MPAPTSADIHLWLVFCREIADGGLLTRYRTLLSEDERAQEQRFRQPEDRHRYLLTRALVRTALSRYLPLSAAEWTFAQDRFGRPHITNQHAGVADISFNISHTRHVILLGVTRRLPLGVDVESLHEPAGGLELAERYFSTREAASLRALPADLQVNRFFDYWTLKESYIKALGMGLSIPLRRFGFDIHGSNIALSAEGQVDDAPERWRFWLFRPCSDHVAAICAQRNAAGSQSLVVRKVVPLVAEQPLEYVELGRSS